MKTNLITLLSSLTVLAFAASSPAADITASPKLRQFLDEHRPPGKVSAANTMPGAACKDTYANRTDWTARGANKPVVTTAKHLCGGCESRQITTGVGKAAHTSSQHTCTEKIKAGCCTKS